MTHNDVVTDLIGNLIYARSGWGDWAKRAKAAGLPGWPLTFETAGALARMPAYKETVPLSESEVKARMRSLLKRRGRGDGGGAAEPRREPQVHLTAVAHAAQGPAHVADTGPDRRHRR